MKIGLISDTHIPDRLSLLPENVIKAFEGVDLILHAGDVTDYEVIEKLEKIAPVLAVEGNMDRRYGKLEDKVYCIYISPLKALDNDIERNLRKPLEEMEEIAGKPLGIRQAVRTGDTSQYKRNYK